MFLNPSQVDVRCVVTLAVRGTRFDETRAVDLLLIQHTKRNNVIPMLLYASRNIDVDKQQSFGYENLQSVDVLDSCTPDGAFATAKIARNECHGN